MPEKLSPEQLIALSPGVDEGELARIRELMEQLRQVGEKFREYGLASPADYRRARAEPGSGRHRTIYLGRRR